MKNKVAYFKCLEISTLGTRTTSKRFLTELPNNKTKLKYSKDLNVKYVHNNMMY